MWYKVNELNTKGLNKSQISFELGLDRSTVRKYLSMDEASFMEWVSEVRHRPKKLKEYANFVKTALESHPYLSASQVEDWLKEHYPDLPQVHSKTVYNFVEQVRREHQIPKKMQKAVRVYANLPETAYGDQAQADFGSFNMQDPNGDRRKVYFFTMVLSRSRQKFAYFQSKPFTSADTVDAHNRAFAYFQGQPDKVLYDQDRVLMVDENLGDLILTREFQQYSSGMKFTPVFCRKADPESNGKVENVVGFVKKNFLRGRTYREDASLNESCLAWLARTGNGKIHAGTKKVPHQEWLFERGSLHPFYGQQQTVNSLMSYKVRKDNTINYKGNFYTLPLGTYQGADTSVLLKVEADRLYLYSKSESLLTVHTLSMERGQTVRNTDHRRDKSQSLETLQAEVYGLLKDIPLHREFMEHLTMEKQRYLRDNLLLIKRKCPSIRAEFMEQAMRLCVEGSMFNAKTLVQTALHYQAESCALQSTAVPQVSISGNLPELLDSQPQTSKISTYQKLMQ